MRLMCCVATCLLLVSCSSQDAPKLVISPEIPSIHRPVKKSFVLTCKGDGNPILFSNLQWFDSRGNEIGPKNRHHLNHTASKTSTELEGGKLLLSFRDPSVNDGGVFQCKGRFQNSIPLSVQVDISFYQDVTFENCPVSQSLVKGRSDGYIKCGVTANPPPIISWLKNDLIVPSERYVIENSGIRVRGIIDESDAGRFDVSARVEETGEVLYQTITVEVYETPKIENVNQDRDAIEGEEVMLTCRASGNPKPLFTWFDPQMRNLSEVGGYYVDRERGVLTISRVRRLEDSGPFICRSSNAAGTVDKSYLLSVITKPTVTSFENVTAVINNKAIFECRATGSPPPRISIRQDGSDQALFEGRDRVQIETRTLDEETVLILTIPSIHRRHDGLFYCSAENKGGRVDRVGHLTVEYEPDLRKTIDVVKTWEQNPVNLTCIADAIPNATISWIRHGTKIYPDNTYRFYNEKGVSNLLVRPGQGGGDVYGLYRCEAENMHGKSFININLERANAPDIPGPIHILKTTPTVIEFEINPPSSDGGMPLRKYLVKYRREHFDEYKELTWPSTGGSYKLEGLEPRMSYLIKFAAMNDVGVGFWTGEQRVVMPYESVPGRVEFILPDPLVGTESGDVRSTASHEFLVQWTKPLPNGRDIDEYKIKYYRVLRSETGWQQVGKSREDIVREKLDLFYFKIHSLESDSFYRMEISARNAIGWSDPSYLVIRTSPDGAASRLINDTQTLGLLIGAIILALLVILIVMDVVFYIKYQAGALYFLKSLLWSSSHNMEKPENGNSA